MSDRRRLGSAGSKQSPALARSYPLSVVIPAHNAEAHLKLCLEALFRNDLTAVEIVVVDDASSDATSRIVSSFHKRSAGVALRCVRLDRHSGPAAARNQGLKVAQNPYLLFLDADIVLPERSLAWIRETLDLYSHRPDVVGVLGVYAEEIPWQDFLSNFKNLYICFLYKSTDTQSPFLHTPIFCIKKEILESTAGFDTRFSTAEDFRLGVQLGARGNCFIIDRKIQGVHRKRYSLIEILREDWRRTRDLRRIQWRGEMDRAQRKFSYQAHRWPRLLSVALPGPALIFAALTPVHSAYGTTAVFLLLVFYLCHLRFLLYSWRLRGGRFALMASCFLFVEMLWAEISLLVSLHQEG